MLHEVMIMESQIAPPQSVPMESLPGGLQTIYSYQPYLRGKSNWFVVQTGSSVVNPGGNDYFDLPSFSYITGYSFNNAQDFIGVMNADWRANAVRMYAALMDSGNVRVKLTATNSAPVRCNWIYVHKL